MKEPTSQYRYFVYVHVNKINGKKYYGQTCAPTPEQRFHKYGSGYRRSPYFWSAIQKYGWDNFEHIILHEGLTKRGADNLEKFYIKKDDTMNPLHGYNQTEGGEGYNLGKDSYSKEYAKQNNRRRYEANREEIIRKNTQYNNDRGEIQKQYLHDYMQTHMGQKRLHNKKYDETHKDENKARHKKYYEEHREQRNAYMREYRKRKKADFKV